MCWKHTCKPFCESLFSSSVALLIMSTKGPSLQCWFQSREQVKISWSQADGSFSVVTLLFAKKSLTKTDRCAGALLWRRNQLLVLHLSGHSLLTATVRWRRKSMCMSLFTITIPVNYTSELWKLFEANTYSSEASFIFGCWHWNRFHNI